MSLEIRFNIYELTNNLPLLTQVSFSYLFYESTISAFHILFSLIHLYIPSTSILHVFFFISLTRPFFTPIFYSPFLVCIYICTKSLSCLIYFFPIAYPPRHIDTLWTRQSNCYRINTHFDRYLLFQTYIITSSQSVVFLLSVLLFLLLLLLVLLLQVLCCFCFCYSSYQFILISFSSLSHFFSCKIFPVVVTNEENHSLYSLYILCLQLKSC